MRPQQFHRRNHLVGWVCLSECKQENMLHSIQKTRPTSFVVEFTYTSGTRCCARSVLCALGKVPPRIMEPCDVTLYVGAHVSPRLQCLPFLTDSVCGCLLERVQQTKVNALRIAQNKDTNNNYRRALRLRNGLAVLCARAATPHQERERMVFLHGMLASVYRR